MERNWLIRTTQKQILGPVTKSKVLEFVEKGALGLSDEVTSGNGYWFSLKEKDLVEKYLIGDIPQGFNPISESRSVLSKRDNPDKTTSLNTAPISNSHVSKAPSSGSIAVPSSSDLEYPDITLVHTAKNLNISQSGALTSESSTQQVLAASSVAPVISSGECGMKLPSSDDLEFPDISKISHSVGTSPKKEILHSEAAPQKASIPSSIPAAIEAQVGDEQLIYPKDDDLAYPDMGSITSVDTNQVAESPPKVEVKKSSSKDLKKDYENDSGLTLDFAASAHEERHEKNEPALIHKKEAKKQEKFQTAHHDDKKLLHERKVKGSTQREATKAMPVTRSPLPEELKKRNDNYLMYILVILVLIIVSLFFYYYSTILNKPLPV